MIFKIVQYVQHFLEDETLAYIFLEPLQNAEVLSSESELEHKAQQLSWT